jgi:hypothetical protein
MVAAQGMNSAKIAEDQWRFWEDLVENKYQDSSSYIQDDPENQKMFYKTIIFKDAKGAKGSIGSKFEKVNKLTIRILCDCLASSLTEISDVASMNQKNMEALESRHQYLTKSVIPVTAKRIRTLQDPGNVGMLAVVSYEDFIK